MAASGRPWLAALAVVAIGAVGAALVSQHVYDMQPCPWCVLQRLIFLAIAAACLVGLALPRLGAALAGLLALSGVTAALWQHFVAASAASCDLTLADKLMAATGLDGRWPELFMATATCAEAKVELAGLPYEFWSLGLFALMALVALRVAMSRRR